MSAYNTGDLGSIPGSGISPGEGNDNPLQYSCLEKSHGLRSLVGYSPWGRKESDTTSLSLSSQINLCISEAITMETYLTLQISRTYSAGHLPLSGSVIQVPSILCLCPGDLCFQWWRETRNVKKAHLCFICCGPEVVWSLLLRFPQPRHSGNQPPGRGLGTGGLKSLGRSSFSVVTLQNSRTL